MPCNFFVYKIYLWQCRHRCNDSSTRNILHVIDTYPVAVYITGRSVMHSFTGRQVASMKHFMIFLALLEEALVFNITLIISNTWIFEQHMNPQSPEHSKSFLSLTLVRYWCEVIRIVTCQFKNCHTTIFTFTSRTNKKQVRLQAECTWRPWADPWIALYSGLAICVSKTQIYWTPRRL